MINKDFRIGHRCDALALLEDMIDRCTEVNLTDDPEHQTGLDAESYSLLMFNFGNQLAALRDAIERCIV